MKRNTLLLAAILAAGTMSAQDLVWTGAVGDSLWSVGSQNFVLEAAPVPQYWSQGRSAIFNGGGSSADGEREVVKVFGDIVTTDIKVSGDKNYLITKSTGTETSTLSGEGAIIKEGTSDFSMEVPVSLKGGIIAREGRYMMENQTVSDVFGDKITFENGTISAATASNTAYVHFRDSIPMYIGEGYQGTVEFPRYSYFESPIIGSGTLNLVCSGERSYVGAKNVAPDWSQFTGNVNVIKNDHSYGYTPGFYGLVMNTNKSISSDDAQDEALLAEAIDSTFVGRKVHLGAGTALSAESSGSYMRVYEFGELSAADATATLYGYYKDNDGQNICYRVGKLNTDVVFPGKITVMNKNDKVWRHTYVTLMKVGTGTYTLTNGNNFITGGIDIREGKLFIANEPIIGTSGTGFRGGGTDETIARMNVITVKNGAVLGGTGIISGHTEVMDGGKVEPGCNDLGTLTFNGYVNYGGWDQTVEANLILNAGSTVEFELRSAADGEYDQIKIADYIRYVAADGKKVNINVTVPAGYEFHNDEIVLISADKGLHANSNGEIEVTFQNVEGVEWSYEEVNDSEGYKLIIKATGDIVSIDNVTVGDKLEVYPNPSASGEFNIQGADIEMVEVLNNQGQLIRKVLVNATSAQLDLAELPTGIYFARVKTTEGTAVKKLIIN